MSEGTIERVGYTTAPACYDYGCTETFEEFEAPLLRGRLLQWRKVRILGEDGFASTQTQRYASGWHGFQVEDPRVQAVEFEARMAKEQAERETAETWLAVADEKTLSKTLCEGLLQWPMTYERVKAKRDTLRLARGWAENDAKANALRAQLPGALLDVRGKGTSGYRPAFYFQVRDTSYPGCPLDHIRVLGTGERGETTLGKLREIVEAIEAGMWFQAVDPAALPPKPVLDRVGHGQWATILRVERCWVGCKLFDYRPIVLDAAGHLIRRKAVRDAALATYRTWRGF